MPTFKPYRIVDSHTTMYTDMDMDMDMDSHALRTPRSPVHTFESYRNAGNQATMDMDVYMDMACSELDATCTPRNPGSYIHVASVCTR